MRLAPQSFRFTLLLGVLAGLPALSIDISAPTLVELPAALGTSTTVAGLSLSLFMVGFAVGQVVAGRVSDSRGRRPVLIAALVTYVVAGIGCAAALSGPGLALARAVQGAGAGGCSVLAFAMVQDLFQGEAARSKRSYITVVFGILPVLAPALGAWLSATAGWRSVHTVLAVAGVALLGVVLLALAESRPLAARSKASNPAAARAAPLRDDHVFRRLALVNALSYGTLFAYIAGAPVVIMSQMGYAPSVYAAAFACTAMTLTAGAWTSGYLGRRGWGAAALVWPALIAQAGAALALALYCRRCNAHDGAVMLLLLAAICFGRGVAAPNLIHLGMGRRRDDAGLASAVFGVVQLLGGAAASAAVAALLPFYRENAVSAPMALLAGGAAALWLATTRRPAVQPATESE